MAVFALLPNKASVSPDSTVSAPAEKVATTPAMSRVIAGDIAPAPPVALELLRTRLPMVPMTRDSWTQPKGVTLLRVVVSSSHPEGDTLLRGRAFRDATAVPTEAVATCPPSPTDRLLPREPAPAVDDAPPNAP